jgi:quercetin dioxygenase-like cupin family protein
LHSHADAESFYLLDGEVEALIQTDGGLEWETHTPGDFIHIPATKHDRNTTSTHYFSANRGA